MGSPVTPDNAGWRSGAAHQCSREQPFFGSQGRDSSLAASVLVVAPHAITTSALAIMLVSSAFIEASVTSSTSVRCLTVTPSGAAYRGECTAVRYYTFETCQHRNSKARTPTVDTQRDTPRRKSSQQCLSTRLRRI